MTAVAALARIGELDLSANAATFGTRIRDQPVATAELA